MTGAALALVLAAAVCHAAWTLVAKTTGGGNAFVLIGSLLVTVLWAPLVLWIGVQEVGDWGFVEWGVLLATAVVHAAYFRCLLHGYAVADLTVVYPVARGGGPLLATAGALLVLGETLSAAAALGALAVVGGVFLVGGGVRLWRGGHDAAERARTRRGVVWGATTAAFIAGYTLIDGYAVKMLLLSPLLVDYFGNVLRIPVMLPFALRDRAGFAQTWRQHWRAALVVATLGPLSYIMVLYAMRMAPLSHVAPAREVSTLLAALAGGTLLREADRVPRLLGALAIAGGVMALALG